MNEPIKAKEFGDYRRNDYANGEELMVEITLAEYRDLVMAKAVAEDKYHKLYMDYISKDNEIEKLNKQIKALMEERLQESIRAASLPKEVTEA